MRHPIVVAWLAMASCSSPAPRTTSTVAPRPDVPGIRQLPSAPADALELGVRVFRWRCTVTDRGGVEDDAVHVPAGRPVRVVFASVERATALDVAVDDDGPPVHVAPGQSVPIVIQIDQPGTYQWRCPTQLPPRPPATNRISVIAHAAADYAAYEATHREQAEPTTPAGKIALAKRVYRLKSCMGCHTVDGTTRIGPSWAGIWGTTVTLADGTTRVVDAAYIRASILTPQAFARPGYPPAMPSFTGQLRPAEIDALIAYIESLASSPP